MPEAIETLSDVGERGWIGRHIPERFAESAVTEIAAQQDLMPRDRPIAEAPAQKLLGIPTTIDPGVSRQTVRITQEPVEILQPAQRNHVD